MLKKRAIFQGHDVVTKNLAERVSKRTRGAKLLGRGVTTYFELPHFRLIYARNYPFVAAPFPLTCSYATATADRANNSSSLEREINFNCSLISS